ncbi:MAG: hypothetical protein HQK79_11325 [Desulfobacterales bacterium]|nr:hypothetical protein [Desulfobacterales bacterium]
MENESQMKAYEELKRGIILEKRRKKKRSFDFFNDGLDDYSNRNVEISDVVQVGSKVVIGTGVGLLTGIATIAVAASAAEVVIAGVVTKIAGFIGGALGLSWGFNKFKKKKIKKLF